MSESKLLLSPDERELLSSLIGRTARQIVWDINAIYVVFEATTFKIEAVVETPESLHPTDYDEACVIRVLREGENFTFSDEGEEGHWYSVIARNEQILDIEIARAIVLIPSEDVVPPGAEVPPDQTANACHCGVAITLRSGILPAIQLNNTRGFTSWPEVRLYSREELLARLGADYRLELLGS
jgi:hypothetical protein